MIFADEANDGVKTDDLSDSADVLPISVGGFNSRIGGFIYSGKSFTCYCRAVFPVVRLPDSMALYMQVLANHRFNDKLRFVKAKPSFILNQTLQTNQSFGLFCRRYGISRPRLRQ